MAFLTALSLFLPLGLFVLVNPGGRADGLRTMLAGQRVSGRFFTYIAGGWTVVGALALLLVAVGLFR
ncbi:hypothetical protein CLM85_14400 [Streptomyces albidoflavus]|uniref:hypothetical protein n=1 Tax=Streptomyces albidoflavus TaxID=1886 RepID=UPI000BAE5E69|nr:hypothetical protein [Streptomyces albidoflavus]MBF4136406.1 hypothetical protein [Streptomyces albidoflavus]PAX88776.1 hypothetical protein CLM81_01740 [Streptomyces albidoflavus]PAX91047.1 hypothetical protein CLM82_11690 [Streptomyces albidoflavus]PBO19349.1 hypothetical protein CLM83_07090 [Streptomyces albidoflavus]PBO23745.1 hypothetical protein CLM85_14400 [Streptomyces albidoflavus]